MRRMAGQARWVGVLSNVITLRLTLRKLNFWSQINRGECGEQLLAALPL